MKRFVPLLLLALAPDLEAQTTVEFDRDIRPILSQNCFLCHGPDVSSRIAGLRLDLEDAAKADRGDGRRVIVPFDADRSEILRRLTAADPDERMPPPETGKQLDEEDVALVRRWIEEGATWQRLWSLAPPRRPAVPDVAAGWPRGPIDRFVLARLNSAGVAPSPAADPEVLLRRVTLDLTGLPPTIEEIDAFRADGDVRAYERAVDRLLASPHYGERMAVPWLDAARYADSYGYQSDQLSPTWPWRDWVVQAFNDNLPYDEFLTWQLAGDLLPEPTRDQRLATAFNRLHRMTNEGGSIAEEFRIEYVADRVHTFGTAVLGLTLGCARCHDHKFDPVTQREYYQFAAFFNSIDEYGLYERADIVPTPSLLLASDTQVAVLDALRREVADVEARLDEARRAAEPAFRAWLADPVRPRDPPDLTGAFSFEAIGEKRSLANDAPDGAAGSTDAAGLGDGFAGNGLKLSGDDHARLAGLDGIDRWSPFTIALWMRDDAPAELPRVILHRSGGTDVGYHGFDLRIVDGHLVARAMRHWPGNGIGVRTALPIAPARWTHVVLRYDGSSQARGFAIFVDGRPAEVEVLRDRIWKTVGHGHNHGPGGRDIVIGQRFRDRGFGGGRVDEVRLLRREVSDLEALALFDARAIDAALAEPVANETVLRAYHASAIDESCRAATARLEAARHTLIALENTIAETMVMEELPAPRPTHLLARGRYDAPRSESTRVERDTPASLPLMAQNVPRDRRGLAHWVTQPGHPLTARVAVNRFWQTFFGRGLVETSEDFGSQGSLPRDPDLLDWLALEFVESGWDVKELCRAIVTSATYRQASGGRPELRAIDPDNDLLGRGPARRLPAEMIRDVALAASGLLDPSIGGPPVSPYQPTGLWRESNTMSPGYKQSVGTALHRRSLYTVLKRTAPMPNMLAFDASSREVCVTRRQRTNTPLQALVLLNDPQFVEAARVLGERMVRSAPEQVGRVELAFRLLTGRRPSERELAALVDLYRGQHELFTGQPQQATALLGVGAQEADAALDPIDVAAATIVAQAILNLDATVWRR